MHEGHNLLNPIRSNPPAKKVKRMTEIWTSSHDIEFVRLYNLALRKSIQHNKCISWQDDIWGADFDNKKLFQHLTIGQLQDKRKTQTSSKAWDLNEQGLFINNKK